MNDSKFLLNKKQLIKKKKILLSLQKDIKRIKYQINHPNLWNAKTKTIKNLKIFSKVCILVTPYILTAGITINVGNNIMEGFEQKYVNKQDINNDFYDNIYISNNIDDMLIYCNKWQKSNNGYERILKIYDNKNIDEATKQILIENNELNCEDIIGNPISYEKEHKLEVSGEELNSSIQLLRVYYSDLNNNINIINETSKSYEINQNSYIFLKIIVIISLMLCTESLVALIKAKLTNSDIINIINKTKNEYPEISISELKKILKIKEQNYNRLMR